MVFISKAVFCLLKKYKNEIYPNNITKTEKLSRKNFKYEDVEDNSNGAVVVVAPIKSISSFSYEINLYGLNKASTKTN